MLKIPKRLKIGPPKQLIQRDRILPADVIFMNGRRL